MSLVLHQTHSKTRNSDVIWCRKHDRRDDGSMSTLITKLLRKQLIITIRPLVSDCTIGYNFSVSCNTRLKSCRKIQSHPIYVSAKIHFDTFYSKQDIAVGIFHVRNNHFLTNQMFFDYPVASFSSTHFENTPVGCNRMPRTQNTWPRFDIHIIDEVIKNPNPKISLSVSSMYRTITFWQIRCFSILMSLVLHQHIQSRRKIQSHSICVSAKIHFDTFYCKQDIAVGIFHVRNNHFLTTQMFFDYPVASFSSTHSKTRQSDVIGCREPQIRDHGSISTLLTKLLKTLTLRYRCRYLPCTEQSLFDKSDVFRFSCRWFCINTFENTQFGCNLMPQTR